jgi:CRISPR-associated protein Csd1
MYLKRLVEFAERENLVSHTAKGYVERQLNWLIQIQPNGRLDGIIPMPKGTKYIVPYRVRSGNNLPPILLYDKLDFVLGWSSDEKKKERTQKRHQAFRDLITACAKETQSPLVQAVEHFYQIHSPEMLARLVTKEMKDGDWFTFQIEREKPIDLPEVQAFWAKWISPDKKESQYQCVICREWCSPLSRHRMDFILPVNKRDSAKLVSANDSAYFSYGLKHALTAPTCEQCEEKYGRALHALLTSSHYKNHRISVGQLVYLFWSRQEEFPAYLFIVQPDSKEIKNLQNQVVQGGRTIPSFNNENFYALSLSPQKSRIVVRDWQEATLEQVRKNVFRFLWHQRMGIEEKYAGVYHLVSSLFSTKNKKETNEQMMIKFSRELLNYAFFGKKLSHSILHQVVQRCKAERSVTLTRARLIRLWLLQGEVGKEDYFVNLETSEKDIGYLCGRLFAVFERIQLDTQGNQLDDRKRVINTTLTDKYYATASTTPAAIFGMLMRNASNHLAKLRKDQTKVNWALYRQKLLEEIAEQIQVFPTTLSLSQQSMFALGYLHQRQAFFHKKTTLTKEENA